MRNKALIFGISGQDGPFLANFLYKKGYEVIGVVRRLSHPNSDFLEDINFEIEIVEGDLSDQASINSIISKYLPDEIYNLAAQSHVGTSFNQPLLTSDVTGIGVLRILEAMRIFSSTSRFFQCSSSEMFGDVCTVDPQNELTELRPRSPYAAAKVFGHNMVKVYRESYGLYAVSGILFNHESHRRSLRFVTKKITDFVGQYVNGVNKDCLKLGYLGSCRDWAYAKDMVEGMWLMLQQDEPENLVLATGVAHSVREFCELAFAEAGHSLFWRGEGVDEVGYIVHSNGTMREEEVVIRIDPEFYRPAEVPYLLGDFSKAYEKLGWYPKTDFNELVSIMVKYDIERYSNVRSKN